MKYYIFASNIKLKNRRNMEFVLLQIGAGIKGNINNLLSQYGVPLIAFLLVVGVAVGVVMNFDKIIDKDGHGTRKEGLINLLWVIGYVVVGLAILSAAVAYISSNVKLSV